MYLTALTKGDRKEFSELDKTIKVEGNDKSSAFLEKLKDVRSALKTGEEVQNKKYYRRVYEGFFVLGPAHEELKGLEVGGVRYVKSEKIFEYPSAVSDIAR